MIKLKDILEQVLLEYEIFNYTKKDDERYEFEVPIDQETTDRLKAQGINIPGGNKLRYYVIIWHDMKKHKFGMYEAEFGFTGQRHPGEVVNLGVKHFMSVLHTCGKIIDEAVEDQKIELLRIQGAPKQGEGAGMLDITTRTKVYLRWAKQKFGTGNVKTIGSYIDIDMKKARPELFKDQEVHKVQLLIDTIMKYLNTSPDGYPRVDLERGVSGTSPTNFDFSTDAIIHKKYGTIYMRVEVSDPDWYNISYQYYDTAPPGQETDIEIDEEFESFDELIDYIKSLA